jgi:LysM repeat protein
MFMKTLFLILGLSLFLMSEARANRDSVGLKVQDGKTFIMHKVSKGEGMYGIARRYSVNVQKLQAANPDAVKNGLEPGQIVLVPYAGKSNAAASKSTNSAPKKDPKKPLRKTAAAPPPAGTATASAEKKPVYHTVASGETLYRIAQNHKVSVDDLKKWNKIPSTGISSGQKLVVGYSSAPVKETAVSKEQPAKKTASPTPSVAADGTDLQYKTTKYGDKIDRKYASDYDASQKKLAEKSVSGTEKKIIDESGKASAIDDGSLVSKKNLAMHRTAPPGTIIKLTNPMNGKSVFVTVVAQLPKDASDGDVAIKITKTAADTLGVLDKYFRVDMHYALDKQ